MKQPVLPVKPSVPEQTQWVLAMRHFGIHRPVEVKGSMGETLARVKTDPNTPDTLFIENADNFILPIIA